MSYCQATTREGQPCRAHHVKGSPYCFWHAPRLERRRKGAAHMSGLATLEDMRKRREEREGHLKNPKGPRAGASRGQAAVRLQQVMPYPPKRVHGVSIRSGLTFPVWMGKTSTPSARPPVSYAPPSGP
jgi:hypothetical protein